MTLVDDRTINKKLWMIMKQIIEEMGGKTPEGLPNPNTNNEK